MRQDWPVAAQTNQPDLADLLAGWSEGSHGTLAQRLARSIRSAIQSGLLPTGTRLPAERTLADQLAVSRSTLSAALDELRSEGVLESRQGSGTVVLGAATPRFVGSRMAVHFGGWSGVDLSAGNPPDPSHLPPVKVDVSDLLAADAGPGVQPLGLPSLRADLADRHSALGLITSPEEIHVTAGAHQAARLAISALVGVGSVVGVEDPSYPGIFDIVDGIGGRVAPIAADRAGLIPEALDRVLSEDRPAVVYLQTGPHNPTGRVPAAGRMRALAEVFDRHHATVVEDVTLADLVYVGRVRPELADLCRGAVVVTVGSFSKVAWAGLRVGWLRAPVPVVERTMHLRLANDLGASVPSQLMVQQLLPHLDEVAEHRRSFLQANVEAAVALVAELLPSWHVEAPEGGSVLWAQLPVDDSGPFVQAAARHGVRVAPGSIATPGRLPGPNVRICVDRQPAMVEAGIQRLALAWRHVDDPLPEPVLG
jgi:DNA-binding transcriptional MocR family regulator